MKEVIVRLTSDHIKVKGAEYVRDLVRCKDCKYREKCEQIVLVESIAPTITDARIIDFCSYGEVRDE